MEIEAYSGTTSNNFRTCLVKRGGMYFFDKTLEIRHLFPTVFYSDNFDVAADVALDLSSRVGGYPLVMMGRVLEDDGYSLRNGEMFPVQDLLALNDNVFLDGVSSSFDKYFSKVSVEDFK